MAYFLDLKVQWKPSYQYRNSHYKDKMVSWPSIFITTTPKPGQIDGVVQERYNTIANALELRTGVTSILH